MMRRIRALVVMSLGLGCGVGYAAKPNVIVIISDDHGWADLSCQGARTDVKTPRIDALASAGVRFTAGYASAPQCVPSRAGLLTGRYQQRFGVDANGKGPLPLDVPTLADRLKAAGYHTGMVGKWHLQPNPTDLDWIKQNLTGGKTVAKGAVSIPSAKSAPYMPGKRGFIDFFHGELNSIHATFDLNGKSLGPEGERFQVEPYRIDAQTEAALQFVRRNRDRPFFLYLGYYAPHVPTAATAKYLDRFPDVKPAKRRYGLAMLAAIDDGVGRLVDELKQLRLDANTLVVFAGDNGAPLDRTMPDVPITNMVWDGSRNDPWIGEKGMLTEGGIRVPFVMAWPGRLPKGAVYDRPVSLLDISATALAAAGEKLPTDLDGVDLAPYLKDAKTDPSGARDPHPELFWRFWSQAAIRAGKWKYLRLGNRAEYLFDLDSKEHESRNRLADHPEIASKLKTKLQRWCAGLHDPGLVLQPTNGAEVRWYEHFLGYQP